MALNKDQLVLDTAALADSDNVGAYIRASDGTLITHTSLNAGATKALDVNVANVIAISATDLDIRDLVFATDKVDVSGSEVSLDAATLAALENITVSATDFDIRDLVFATDKVDVSGSEVSLDAATLAALENITVSATDFDIRNLDYSQDNVAVKGATGNQLVVNADGSINANVDVSVVNGSDKAEDAVHASADIGTYTLSVRQDVLSASSSASGDYQSFKTDSQGRTYTNSSAQSAAFSAVSVDATVGGIDLVPTDLVNRKKILIQNTSSKAIFIGNSGVTITSGIKVPASSSAEFEVSEQCNLFAITASGSADVRIMEIA